MTTTDEQWQQVAIEIGDCVYRTVNTAETVGTDDETGYILMFFNAKKHEGKSTLVSSSIDRATIKKLLKMALRQLAGRYVKIVGPAGNSDRPH
jgi:hypothetical protein